MALRNTWRSGDHLVRCDRTGFTVYASETAKEWNGLRVRHESWEPRHPQEFVRGVHDRQGVDDARPQPSTPSGYPSVGPVVTSLEGGHSAGATTINVVSSSGMTAGDTLKLGLTTNEIQSVTLSAKAGNALTISPGLLAAATDGALVQDFSARVTATGGY